VVALQSSSDSSPEPLKPPRDSREAALIVNAKARRGAEWFSEARRALIDGGMHLVEARAVRHPRDIPFAVKEQILARVPLVIVGGGDGTLSAVSNLFVKSQAVMGVLPLGTGNAFARDLGIGSTIEAACDAIVNGKPTQVDMGLIGDRGFLNIATIGLTSKIALGVTNKEKKAFGRAIYLISLIKALAIVRPFKVELELGSEIYTFDCLQLVIGNGRFHAGPFPITPDASITGGRLSVYALADRRKSAFLKLAIYLLSGSQVNLEGIKSFRVDSGKLSAKPVQRITVDGETVMKTPVEFGIMPGALRVMTPQDFGNAENK
jgi:diacylglycerol kinase (ATP)